MSRSAGKTPVMKGALVVTACVPAPEELTDSLREVLTPTQSAALYHRFLLDIVETSADVEGMDFYFAYGPRGHREKAAAIAPERFRLICQEGSDTGARFSRVTRRLFDRGYERVFILCSTHPDLPACLLHQAVDALERREVDIVFGPNERGRFYLIGLKGNRRSLFTDVDWDAPQLDLQVLNWAREQRVRMHRLPQWYDVHTVEDLRRHLRYHSLRQDSPPASASAGHTGRYLESIKGRLLPAHC